MGLSPEQVTYLRDVLGIDGVIIPAGGISIPVAVADVHEVQNPVRSATPGRPQPLSTIRTSGSLQFAKMIALAASEGSVYPCEGEAADLAAKMIQAMKIKPTEVLWVEWTHTGQEPCPHEVLDLVDSAGDRPVLAFGASTGDSLLGHVPSLGSWVEWNGVRIMTTLSLQELLANPAKKKESWAHLQMVMRIL